MTINELSKRLNLPIPWLMTVFKIESGNNPRAVNPYTGARGLIQFMPFVLEGWGIDPNSFTTDYNKQLDYVYKYLKPYAKKIKSITDLYLAVFYPAAIGKKLDFVIGSEVSPARAAIVAKQNPGFKAFPIRKKNVQKVVFANMAKVGLSRPEYYLQKFTR